MKHLILSLTALFSATALSADVLSFNFTNTDGPRQVLPGEDTGVISDTNWVNLSVSVTDVAGTAVDITLGGVIGTANTLRDKGFGDGTDGFLALFEAGLRDSSAATADDTFVTVSDMSAFLGAVGGASYNIYAYYKSPLNNISPDTVALGLTTSAFTDVDPDGTSMSVNDTFVVAGNPESNYILFPGLNADSTTVYFNRVSRDGIFAGIQIETIPVPEPSVALLGVFSLLALFARRHR